MSFATQVLQFSIKSSEKLDAVRRGTCLKLFSAVILDTPVLSGHLRGNWQCVEAEGPIQTTLETTDKSGGATIAAMNAAIQASKGNRPTFLSNNLPYAEAIEFEGHSHTKAPEGMVRINVARFAQLIAEENAKA